VPTMSMIRRKDSMTALIAGKCGDFQCCCKRWKAIAADTAASTEANCPSRTTSNIQSSAQRRVGRKNLFPRSTRPRAAEFFGDRE